MNTISNNIGSISTYNYGGYGNSNNTRKQMDDDTVQSLAETRSSKKQAAVYAASSNNATDFYDSTSDSNDDQSEWYLYNQTRQTYTQRTAMTTMADSRHISIVV